jgi:hypothetical protein
MLGIRNVGSKMKAFCGITLGLYLTVAGSCGAGDLPAAGAAVAERQGQKPACAGIRERAGDLRDHLAVQRDDDSLHATLLVLEIEPSAIVSEGSLTLAKGANTSSTLPRNVRKALVAQLKAPGDVSAVIETPEAFRFYRCSARDTASLKFMEVALLKPMLESRLAKQ